MDETIFKTHDWKYKVGLTLIIFSSIIIGIFNIGVLYLFGIPLLLLLVGIILISLAEENVKTKVFLILLPIPIIISIFSLMYWLNKAEPEIYLIPQNYRGDFQIRFDEPCGESITYDGNRRIYRIPESGVLVLKGKQTQGFIDRKFFLIDDNGNLTKLPEFYWSKFEDEEKQFNSIFSNKTLTKDLLGVFNHPNSIEYQRVTVSNYQSLENETRENSEMKARLFQTKVDYLLKKCRQ